MYLLQIFLHFMKLQFLGLEVVVNLEVMVNVSNRALDYCKNPTEGNKVLARHTLLRH